jgi:Ino eighty subunit 2
METINKLLKKQAPKTNARRRDLNGLGGVDSTPDGEPSKPNPIYVRWTSNKYGNQIHVPTELTESPAGRLFATGGGLSSRKMVEEIQ